MRLLYQGDGTLKRLIILLITLSLTACGSFLEDERDCNDSLFDGMRVAAPSSAQFSNERCAFFINPTYRATFTIDPADLQALQDSTPITAWDTDVSGASIYEAEAASLSSLIVGTHGDGAYATEVLIDTTNPDLYTVYYYRAFID
jgi:hypothetical protein